jgi:hypothetical protein
MYCFRSSLVFLSSLDMTLTRDSSLALAELSLVTDMRPGVGTQGKAVREGVRQCGKEEGQAVREGWT